MNNTQQRHPEFLEDQREFFDELVTSVWDSYSSDAWDRSRMLEVQELFARVTARTVLDVGCGVGFHDKVIAQMPGVERVVGIDYSPKSIETAEREYPHPRVERRVDDVFSLDECGYDLVVSFQVIEHLTDPLGFLRACAKLCRPGGHVSVATPNRERLHNRYLRLRRRPPELVDPQHFQEFSRDDLRDLGADAGLRPVGGFGYGLTFYPPRMSRPLPSRAGLRAGGLVPAAADVICQIYDVAGEDPPTNRVYDDTAATYGDGADRSDSGRMKRSLLGRYVRPDQSVLDVGCANGIHLREVESRCGELAGLDPSAEMLARARANVGRSDVRLDQGVAELLPYDDAEFDLVYCFSTLAVVRDADASVREMARVLRPGGIALLDIPGARNLSQRHWSRWWREQGHPHYNSVTKRRAFELLDHAGLTPLETHALGALDQLKYVRGAGRFGWIEQLGEARGEEPGLDYRISNLRYVDRLANRWYVAAVKA